MINGNASEISGARKFFIFWGWVIFVVQGIALLGLCYLKVDFTDIKWETFVNSWLAIAWTRINVVLGVVWFLDWVTKGYTHRAILNIDEKSTTSQKAVAAFYLLGIASLCAWCMLEGI